MKSRKELDAFGQRILNQSRTELYLAMHFMARALDSLGYVMDLNTRRCGTDGKRIHFNPEFVFHLFLESPQKLNRLYVHMLLHCLFRHMFSGDGREQALWNLACDIHAEAVLDSMSYRLLLRPPGDFRAAWYEKLEKELGLLSAERLYRYFEKEKPAPDSLRRLSLEFTKDDHQFWVPLPDSPETPEPEKAIPPELMPPEFSPPPGGAVQDTEDRRDPLRPLSQRERELLGESWKETAERLETEIETFGRNRGEESGRLSRYLRLQYRKRTDFRDFLRRLSVEREENVIDTDSFDYGYYHYGMELYGNMPLLEENEYREARKVEDLIIAIDTSASCDAVLVQLFLNETAALLSDKEGFFRRVRVHIIECDDRVQEDIVLRETEEMEHYAEHFRVSGGFGTDFRPVFSYVEELRKKGELPHLRGLLYFTDGYGKYPASPREYLTAFVFPRNADSNEDAAPDWALKLYI